MKELWHLQCSGSNFGAKLKDLDPNAHLDFGFGSKHLEIHSSNPIHVFFIKSFLKTPCRKRRPDIIYLLSLFLENCPNRPNRV